MIQIKYGCVIFLVALFVVTLESGCSSSNKPLSISPTSVALAPGQTVQFQLSETRKNVTWSAGGVAGGNATVGTIDSSGNYTAPSANTSTNVMITATVGSHPPMSAQVVVVAPGIIAPTANPQVALYTISPPDDASVTIQFGQTTNYGLTTWTLPTPTGGGAVAIFVAGMLANTPYHMQATVKFSSGLTFTDIDHTFTTKALTTGSDSQTHCHDDGGHDASKRRRIPEFNQHWRPSQRGRDRLSREYAMGIQCASRGLFEWSQADAKWSFSYKLRHLRHSRRN